MRWWCALLLCLASAAQAEDFFGTVETRSENREVTDLDSPWQYRGWLQQKIGYGYREPAAPFNRQSADLTRVETQFYNEVDWRQDAWRVQLAGSIVQDWLPDLERAGLWSGYEFTREQYDQRRWRLELADTYVSWQHADWWLKAGYQTLAWGEAESLKVTDILARRDQRWPGQEDLEKLRLPVPAATLTWQNRIDLAVLVRPLPDRQPAAYAEFDPRIGLRTGNPDTDPRLRTQKETNPGIALRWRESWQGVDMQLIFADVASYETAPVAIAPQAAAPPIITFTRGRQQVLGLGVQATHGTWLLRSEQAWHRGVYAPGSDTTAPWQQDDEWRGMIGADYTGVHNLTLTGEVTWLYRDNSHGRHQAGGALRARYTLFNERLTLEAFNLYLPGGEDSLVRLSGEWEYSDKLNLSLAIIDYSAEEQKDLLHPYRHNDTVLLTVRWML